MLPRDLCTKGRARESLLDGAGQSSHSSKGISTVAMVRRERAAPDASSWVIRTRRGWRGSRIMLSPAPAFASTPSLSNVEYSTIFYVSPGFFMCLRCLTSSFSTFFTPLFRFRSLFAPGGASRGHHRDSSRRRYYGGTVMDRICIRTRQRLRLILGANVPMITTSAAPMVRPWRRYGATSMTRRAPVVP